MKAWNLCSYLFLCSFFPQCPEMPALANTLSSERSADSEEILNVLNHKNPVLFVWKWFIVNSKYVSQWSSCQNSRCFFSRKLPVRGCMRWCVHVFCWFRPEEMYSAHCFYHHTQLSWKFSSVFPPGRRALHFWLIKVISHFGATFAIFTSSNLISACERSATISGLLGLLKMTFMLWFPPLDVRSSHMKYIC